MDIIKVFGSNVRKYRTKKKVSQEKFAEVSGNKDNSLDVISRGSILRRKEHRNGKSQMSDETISGMDIPDYAIERIARCLLPIMQEYFENEERQLESEEQKNIA